MASAAKKIRTVAGVEIKTPATGASKNPAVPLNQLELAFAVLQLQAAVNELIARFNVHQHSALNAAPSVGLVTGTAQAATNLFPDN